MSERGSSSKFLQAAFSGSVLSIVRLFTGLFRTKLTALIIGASGLGLLAQSNLMLLLLVSLGSLSLVSGVTNSLNEQRGLANEGSGTARTETLSTAFTAQAVFTATLVLLGTLYVRPLSASIFGAPGYERYFLIVLWSSPFSVMASGYLEGVLFGFARFDHYVKASLIATLVGVSFFIPLTYRFGLAGAFVGVAVNSIALFVTFLAFARRSVPASQLFSLGFSGARFRGLMKFGLVMFVTGALEYWTSLWIRSMVVDRLGAESNGILQVPIALGAYLSPFITNPLWGRLHPFVGSKGDRRESHLETNVIVRITVGTCAIAIVWIILLQEYFVRLVYSRSFIPSLPLIPIQLSGEFFHLTLMVFSVYFLGASMLRTFFVLWVGYYAFLAALTSALVAKWGLIGVPWAYLALNTACCGLAAAWWNGAGRRPMGASTLGLFLVSASGVGAQAAMTHFGASFWVRALLPILGASIFALYAQRILRLRRLGSEPSQ